MEEAVEPLAYVLVFLICLLVAVGTAVVMYVREVRASLKQLLGRHGTDAMRDLERSLAIGDLLSYAVLADGQVSEAEWTALQEALETTGVEVTEEIGLGRIRARDEGLARLRARASEAWDGDTLRHKIVEAARALDAADREKVFAHVLAIAAAGAGIVPEERGYRSNPSADPRRLVEIYGEALAIPPERQLELERRRGETRAPSV
jgi:uncharacterized tellurite resistance protein B-like protein